jgi:hypothetical protein
MSNPTPGSGGHDQPSTTIGVGGQTSGQQGASPTHETQQETGGNGGAGLTRNQAGPDVNAPNSAPGQVAPPTAAPDGAPVVGGNPREPADSAMTHANPGAQDTRSGQAGVRDTGMGAPETGGNQDQGDLPPPRS